MKDTVKKFIRIKNILKDNERNILSKNYFFSLKPITFSFAIMYET